MHLTRLGFNLLVICYLAPLVIMDLVGNTVSTGFESDMYYWKALFDGALICFATYEAFAREPTASVSKAQAKINDRASDIVDFATVHSYEYVYCLCLAIYAAANWFLLHQINRSSTGFTSLSTMLWSFLSLAVAALAAYQFWNLKSGKIVELRSKIMQ